ncbi:MAG: response regulator [Pleurocapsa sp.]
MLNQQLLLKDKSRAKCSPLVLVVDDNEDNVMYACGSLDLYSCEHIVAQNGQAALDLAKDKLPDLILMDIVMPKVDGISLTRMLRSNLSTSRIPIIAVTGLAFTHQKEHILNSGFDDYLCKPYLIEDLENKLNFFLN